jgi:hypothetical protein
VVLAAAFSLVRDWLIGRRDDQQRKADAAEKRIQYERDIIGELIVGLHFLQTSVVNRKRAFDAFHRGQGEINPERFQKYLADAEAFVAVLSRARVSVQNPGVRPHLDALRQQALRMSGLLNLVAEGMDVADFEARFEEFQTVTSEANRGLEDAALRWDGRITWAELATT